MESSGADKGFFQTPPVLTNQFFEDASHRRCFHLFLSPEVIAKTTPEVASLGEQVISDQIFSWVSDAEHNTPRLKGSGRDAFGKWNGELVTSEGWRRLQAFGLAKGFVAAGYDTPFGSFSRPLQFLRLHLWEPSCANVTCPSAMQDGAARLLQLHLTTPRLASRLSDLERKVFTNSFRRLTSRDPDYAWTSGQWMTERTGGSDVSLIETTAVKVQQGEGTAGQTAFASKKDGIPLGPWTINGFKWFSSATDCQMTVLLAKTPAGGLSAFLAPMRKHDTQKQAGGTRTEGEDATETSCLNGVRIQRLKNKLGTRSLPTAELVLQDMRGWLIGQESKGVQEISTVLTLTRAHSAVAAVGYVGRGLAIARAYSRVREIGAGKGARVKLTRSSLHMKTMADMHSQYRGLMLLTMYTSFILGLSEHQEPTSSSSSSSPSSTPAQKAITPSAALVDPLLRVLSQLTKAYVCKTSISLLFSCMEALGGVGYLENQESEYLNIARLYRDCAVLPIWEGTTDVLCTDFVRALKHPKGGDASLDALGEVIGRMSTFGGNGPDGDAMNKCWGDLRRRIEGRDQGDLMRDARELLWEVGDLLVGGLLRVDARRDGDDASTDIYHRFASDRWQIVMAGEESNNKSTEELLARDSAIVFGLREQTAPRPAKL